MGSPALIVRQLVTDLFGGFEGVGLDVVDVRVLTDLVADGGQEFLDACWTPAEQVDTHRDPERLAGRWAGKEAVMKCLGAGIGDVELTDIELLTLPSGAPTVALHGGADDVAQSLGLDGWLVSITHEAGWAAAIAVAHRQPRAASSTPSLEGTRGGDRHV